MRIGWRTDDPPSEREKYLVQLDSGEMAICEWSNVNPFWTNLTTDWHWFNRPQYTKVVAWHALPQPYRKTELSGYKLKPVEDEPQIQLTAKCLDCNNSKDCKENHWKSCRYEPLGYEVTAVVGTINTEPQTERGGE